VGRGKALVGRLRQLVLVVVHRVVVAEAEAVAVAVAEVAHEQEQPES